MITTEEKTKITEIINYLKHNIDDKNFKQLYEYIDLLNTLVYKLEISLNKSELSIYDDYYYNVICKKCNWTGSSKFLLGGCQIADTGDYDDLYCPFCNSKDLKDL